jgi:hypothetical protein
MKRYDVSGWPDNEEANPAIIRIKGGYTVTIKLSGTDETNIEIPVTI